MNFRRIFSAQDAPAIHIPGTRLIRSSGSLFFAVPRLGSRFRENFRRILSAKDTLDREYALSFAIRRIFSTEERPEIHIPGAKLLRESGAPGGVPQKPGTRNGELAGES